jgi:hypothetical protein
MRVNQLGENRRMDGVIADKINLLSLKAPGGQ